MRSSSAKGDQGEAQHFATLAIDRREAIRRLMWNPHDGFFTDYLWREGRQSDVLSAATVFPLCFRVATSEQAHAMAAALRQKLREPGGLGTTEIENGQQWDRPNGWPPLQYLAIEGLEAKGERDLAGEIADRWLTHDCQGLCERGSAGGEIRCRANGRSREAAAGAEANGELQVGFGWTNGVLAKLMAEFPVLSAHAQHQNP
jgi:alpha,alpha-trehalase